MKDGSRFLGIDDASFSFEDDSTEIVGTVYRGTEFLEDVVVKEVSVDGYNATQTVIELHDSVKNPGQVSAVLVDGISLAGFNIVDIEEVAEKIGKPVVAVTSNKPNRDEFRDAMERTGNEDEMFEKFKEPDRIEMKDGECYIQYAGTGKKEAEEVVRKSTIHGLVPEPVRTSHMIGRALMD